MDEHGPVGRAQSGTVKAQKVSESGPLIQSAGADYVPTWEAGDPETCGRLGDPVLTAFSGFRNGSRSLALSFYESDIFGH